MRKFHQLLFVAGVLAIAVPAVGQLAIPLASKRTVDQGLLAQQRFTADVAAAAFVAMQNMMDAALTNQLLTTAVLYAYTNSLDAADGQQFLSAIERHQSATMQTLNQFLQLQQSLNDQLRVDLAEELRLAAQLGALESVAKYAPGLVTEDSTEPTLTISNQTHHAWRPRLNTELAPILRIAPVTETEVATRFTASLLLCHTGTVTIATSDGTSFLRVGPEPRGWTLVDIDQYSSTMYVIRTTEVE